MHFHPAPAGAELPAAPPGTDSARSTAAKIPGGPPPAEAGGEPPGALDNALARINDAMAAWSTDMRFDIDPDTRTVVISIIDSASGDVLRSVPNDAALQVAKMIIRLQGHGLDTKA